MKLSPPPIHLATIPALLPAERFTLTNGLKVVALGGVEAPVLRVELIWDAGRPFEPVKLASSFVEDLLLEGTASHSAAEVEAYFEQFGTQLDQPDVMDTSNLGVSVTHRWAAEVLPMMGEVAATAALSEESFARVLRQRRQRLREDLADNDMLAYRLITEATYGADHPYGYNGYPHTYAAVDLEQIRAYYRSHYHAGNATLFVTGKLTEAIMRLLERAFGGLPTGPAAAPHPLPPCPAPCELLQVSRPRAEQTMIRSGRAGIDINRADYPELVVMNTVFGGYFGSRLMRNIREDKGLTYGIESELDAYRYNGDFGISADVANESLSLVRREIATEAERMRQDPIGGAELEMVRAYLSGMVANSLDGVLGHASRHRAAIIKGYDPHRHLQRLSQIILEVSPQRIREVAQTYLSVGDDWELIVGGAKRIKEARLLTEATRGLSPNEEVVALAGVKS